MYTWIEKQQGRYERILWKKLPKFQQNDYDTDFNSVGHWKTSTTQKERELTMLMHYLKGQTKSYLLNLNYIYLPINYFTGNWVIRKKAAFFNFLII